MLTCCLDYSADLQRVLCTTRAMPHARVASIPVHPTTQPWTVSITILKNLAGDYFIICVLYDLSVSTFDHRASLR